MENWFAELEQALNTAATEAEQWLSVTLDTVIATSETVTEALEDSLDQALDELDQVIEPWASTAASGLTGWLEEVLAPVNQVVDPWIQDHPRCMGCRNYHGQTYGDQTLICAIHPYGPEASLDQCPDWESSWPQPGGKGGQ
jgi:hypothetical protein